MSTGEAVRTFGVDISSVKRYVATARRVAGVWVSDSTVTRMPEHLVFVGETGTDTSLAHPCT
jgi:hypothetical protein